MDDENGIIWQGGYSISAMLGAWFGAAFVSTLTAVLVFKTQPLRENRAVWVTMFALIAITWIGLIGVMSIRMLSRRYEISKQQIRRRKGIFLRKVNCIEMIDVEKVTYRQGLIQSLMGVGTIRLKINGDSQSDLVMLGIANVSRVAKAIDDARQAERQRHGIPVVTK